MFKKFILSIIIFCSIIPIVKASDNAKAKIGNNYYDSLVEAIEHAGSNDIISLTSNVSLEDTLAIDKTINLNLNGRTISAPEKVFLVSGGTLNLTGTGTIKEINPNYGAIILKGSDNPNDKDYSVVTVGKDITLEGWSGLFITHDNKKSYGVKINFDGKINSFTDANGTTGAGIYTNGNIQDNTNPPIINITDNAKITSTGNGLYIAGYSKVNIGNSYISGIEAAIGIKAGILNIDGATLVCTGEDKTPTSGYNNGIKPSGTTIQIESNSGYAGNIELNIKSGNLTSKHSNVIYEYIGKGTTTKVNQLNITGGTFISEAQKEIFSLSQSLKDNHPNFISGGKYSSNPGIYLNSGYTTTKANNLYTVIKSTMKEISLPTSNSNKKVTSILIAIIAIIISLVALYFTKRKTIKL